MVSETVENELCVLQWLGVKLGIPDKMLPYIRGDGRPNRIGGATILSSASECVFMATTMAIEHSKKLKLSVAREVLVVYCATTAHSCVLKACLILGVVLVKIGVDKNMSISLTDLTFAIESSIASGLTPCMVVATFGSTACGSIDNISEVAKIAKRFKLYMHIDGAYGGSALLMRKFRAKCGDLNNVDSINLNPNKCLQVTLDCGCMWYSNRELLNHLHDKSALYVEYDGIVDGLEVPSNDCGISLSRPFRSLKLFFVLMSVGVVELRRLMVQQIRETNLIVSHLQRFYGNLVEMSAREWFTHFLFSHRPNMSR